jgi:hypothetical protein
MRMVINDTRKLVKERSDKKAFETAQEEDAAWDAEARQPLVLADEGYKKLQADREAGIPVTNQAMAAALRATKETTADYMEGINDRYMQNLGHQVPAIAEKAKMMIDGVQGFLQNFHQMELQENQQIEDAKEAALDRAHEFGKLGVIRAGEAAAETQRQEGRQWLAELSASTALTLADKTNFAREKLGIAERAHGLTLAEMGWSIDDRNTRLKELDQEHEMDVYDEMTPYRKAEMNSMYAAYALNDSTTDEMWEEMAPGVNRRDFIEKTAEMDEKDEAMWKKADRDLKRLLDQDKGNTREAQLIRENMKILEDKIGIAGARERAQFAYELTTHGAAQAGHTARKAILDSREALSNTIGGAPRFLGAMLMGTYVGPPRDSVTEEAAKGVGLKVK